MKSSFFQQIYRESIWIYAGLVIVVLVALLVGLLTMLKLSEKRHVAQTRTAIATLAERIQSNYKETGHYPADEIVCRELLGKNRPRSEWNGELEYQLDPKDPKHFYVHAESPGYELLFQYDSQHPEKGVSVFPF